MSETKRLIVFYQMDDRGFWADQQIEDLVGEAECIGTGTKLATLERDHEYELAAEEAARAAVRLREAGFRVELTAVPRE